MSSRPTAFIAFTSPINPPDTTPSISQDQIWAGLQRKVRHAEEFVGGAIKSTTVVGESADKYGREVITRDVIFSEGNREAREVCTFSPPMCVEFLMADGTKVLNTVSEGAGGELYLTYQFEWYMAEGTSAETQQENIKKWKSMAKTAVEKTIVVVRQMVQDGKL